jgi:DNA-binding winged helix-turn-helix (wHTH) protein
VAGIPDSAETLYAGELEIRPGDGLVLAGGRALTLSVREFELLVAMARRLGAIVTRDELYGNAWGGELRPGDRSVDVYVSKLRVKLETAMPDRRFIHTHPGFGYRFQAEPSQETTARNAGSLPNPRGETDPGRTGIGFHEMFTSARPALKRLFPAAEAAAGSSEP